MANNKKTAVFLDRDGTIIEDRGHLRSASDVVFFDDTFDALRKLQKYFLLFIVTNQSGVAQGAITRADVNRVNAHVVSTLNRQGVRIRDLYVCPHDRSDGCRCIKPKPWFLQRAAAMHGLDLGGSFTIGDHPHDIKFAHNVGAAGIYVLTGHGQKHLGELPENVETASGLYDAAEIILRNRGAAASRLHRRNDDEIVLDMAVAADLWERADLPRTPADAKHVAEVLTKAGIRVHEVSGGWLACEPRPAAVHEALTGKLAPPDWLERFDCQPEKPGCVLKLLAASGIRVCDA